MWDWEMMVFMDRIHFLVPEFIFTCSGGMTSGGGGHDRPNNGKGPL